MIRTILLLGALSASLSAALPYEAAELKAKRDAKIAEINSAYLGALSKLADRYAADGESAKAEEVKKMLENPDGAEDPSEADNSEKLKPLVGVWKRDTDNGIWKITDTKGGVFNGNEPFSLKFDSENNRVVVVGAKWVNYFTFASNPNVVYGRYTENGKTARYKLSRVQ